MLRILHAPSYARARLGNCKSATNYSEEKKSRYNFAALEKRWLRDGSLYRLVKGTYRRDEIGDTGEKSEQSAI